MQRIGLLLVAGALAVLPTRGEATGCGCVPISLPLGEQFKSHAVGALRLSYGISYSDTDHYYIGSERDAATETNVAPATLGVEQILGIENDAAPRLTLIGEVLFIHTEQSREFGGVAGSMKASGLGEMRLLARYWISDRPEGLRWYSWLGLRLPTGESDAKVRAQNGTLVTKDLAAQAGTGNYAGIVEIGGAHAFGRRLALGFAGRYVFTPEATTVNNFRHELTGNGPEKNSDSDAANARVSRNTPLGAGDGIMSRMAARGKLGRAAA